jgi:hypothetical protein
MYCVTLPQRPGSPIPARKDSAIQTMIGPITDIVKFPDVPILSFFDRGR